MGETGRGTDEHWGLLGQVDIVNSTLGKALGGATGAHWFAPVPCSSLASTLPSKV